MSDVEISIDLGKEEVVMKWLFPITIMKSYTFKVGGILQTSCCKLSVRLDLIWFLD